MGRGKLEIKRIENQTNRQVTFSKRRNGLLKKAKEIAVLCDVKVSLIIFGPNSKIYSNDPNPETMSSILEDYQKNVGHRLWDTKHEDLNSEIERMKKENENMNIKLRHLKAEDVPSLKCEELIAVDDLLEDGLTRIRDKKNELVNRLMERRDLEELENARLQHKLAKLEINYGKMGDGICNSHMPFSFRVQPRHPNLQNIT